jgi:FkbH-like protein
MVLKLEDITVFVANWDEKPTNLRKIREALNIGFDSMVFLDDSPFERNAVRSMLPEIIVPELPEDAADYVKVLIEANFFETTSFSALDTQRVRLYSEEEQRKAAELQAVSFDAYLESLNMKIVTCPPLSFT